MTSPQPRVREIPLENGWLVKNQLDRVDFEDAFAVDVDPALPNDPQWWIDLVFANPPKPVVAMMWLRNLVMKPFGVKRSKEDAVFAPLDANEHEIVLGTNDKHLNFRASVIVEQRDGDQTVTMTTVVKFNNKYGRLYFVPVKPMHKYVVLPMLLRHAAKSAAKTL